MMEPKCSVLAAVGTKSDGLISEHFGHARKFHIYRVSPGGVDFVEERGVEHYCQDGLGDEDRREVILRALADCKACFVARIGDGPKEKLAEAGIEAVDDFPYGEIQASLMEWFLGFRLTP